MNLETYYLSSVSVAATLFSIILIGFSIVGVGLAIRLKKILDKLDRLTDTTSGIAHNVKGLVQVTTQRIISIEKAYLTLQGLRQVAGVVANAFHNRKVYREKGATHETR